VCTSRAIQISEPRSPRSTVNTPMYRGISYREIGIWEPVILSTFKTPNADARCHVSSSAPSPWDPSRLAISRFLRAPLDVANAEVPSPDSTGSRATCPSTNRRLRLNRGIAIRDFNVHVTLALANPDVPIYDSSQTPLCACRLTPSQLLPDLTVYGISEICPTTPSRRFSSFWKSSPLHHLRLYELYWSLFPQ
jgi:hypothetical protein